VKFAELSCLCTKLCDTTQLVVPESSLLSTANGLMPAKLFVPKF